jgi:hypothetical protein
MKKESSRCNFAGRCDLMRILKEATVAVLNMGSAADEEERPVCIHLVTDYEVCDERSALWPTRRKDLNLEPDLSTPLPTYKSDEH